jgi:hypothetical protein
MVMARTKGEPENPTLTYLRGRLLKHPDWAIGKFVDLEAEYGLTGCMLEDVQPAEFEPGWMISVICSTLFLATDQLQKAGTLSRPRDYDDFLDCRKVALTNAELVAFEIDRTGVWPDISPDGPRWHLGRCIECATGNRLIDHYADRIRQAFYRRRVLGYAEQLQTAALSPVPIGPEVLQCLNWP